MVQLFSTQQDIDSILLDETSKRQEFIDTKVQGLKLSKRKNGLAKWSLSYICPRSAKIQTYQIGLVRDIDLSTARFAALGVIEREYPLHELNELRKTKLNFENEKTKSSQNLTLKEFVDQYYLPFITTSKRSYQTDVSILNNHILPILGSKEVQHITTFDVQKMIQAMSLKGLASATSNRALIITRFMFNCLMKWELFILSQNPCLNLKEKVENNKRERYLNSEEVSRLRQELLKSKNKFLPYMVQLMILTGCRRGEALNSKIIHFDFARASWIVPLPKGGKARHVPLNEMAIQTVKATIAFRSNLSTKIQSSEFLFPSPITGEPFKQIHYSWDKARIAAQLKDVRMHDLRHSFASAMVNEGMTLYDVKQILGHTNIKTTERYAHLSNVRLRQAASSVLKYYGDQNWLQPKINTI